MDMAAIAAILQTKDTMPGQPGFPLPGRGRGLSILTAVFTSVGTFRSIKGFFLFTSAGVLAVAGGFTMKAALLFSGVTEMVSSAKRTRSQFFICNFCVLFKKHGYNINKSSFFYYQNK